VATGEYGPPAMGLFALLHPAARVGRAFAAQIRARASSWVLPAWSTDSSPRSGTLLCVCALIVSGCLPKIGDDCQTDADCSQVGDRVCDTSQYAGYCTQFNCTPESCPLGEGICVAFGNTPSLVHGCSDEGRPSPYARSFCMKPCETSKDCREEYECIDLAGEDPWAADVIQKPPSLTRVCVVPQSASALDLDLLSGLEDNVCSGPKTGFGGGAGASGTP
jgi:hypothetical protein